MRKAGIGKSVGAIALTGIMLLQSVGPIGAQTLQPKVYVLEEQEVSKSGYAAAQWIDEEGQIYERESENVKLTVKNGEVTQENTAFSLYHASGEETAEEFPTSYDLRDVDGVSYVTSVKNQGITGSCWAFATVSALETSLLLQDNDRQLDLSEAHLVNVTQNMNTTDEQDATANDNGFASTAPFHDGGNSYFAVASLARWAGAEEEKSSPFYPESISSMLYDESKRYVSEYRITDDEYVPTGEHFQHNMKTFIMQSGAVIGGFYSGYSATPLEYYYTSDASKKADHEVAIVGWDDTIPASRFVSVDGESPEHDGAWLVKNSWGTKRGMEGYCWLSYDDVTLTECNVITVVDAEQYYDNNYQYTGAYPSTQICVAKTANVFTAKNQETINAVSFYTQQENVDYTIAIYTDDGNAALQEPDFDKKKKRTKTGTVACAGYHTIALDDTLMVKQGERFSVVLTLKCNGANAWQSFEGKNASAKTGQSYYYCNNSWHDTCDETGVYDNLHNCFLRVFTTDCEQAAQEKIENAKQQLQCLVESSAQVQRGNVNSQIWNLYRESLADAKKKLENEEATYCALTNAYLRLLSAKRKVKDSTCEVTKDATLTISSPEEWVEFAQKVQSGTNFNGTQVVLSQDIDLSEYSSQDVMAGSASAVFAGDFDGRGHEITVTISDAKGNVALFPYVNYGAICNVTVSGTITSSGTSGNTAAIAAQIKNGRIDNCCANVEITSDNDAGGIVGTASDTKVIQCSNKNTIVCREGNAGGIAANLANNASISCSGNTGDIKSQYYVGGLVGFADAGAAISDCYVGTCDLKSDNQFVGDIVGNKSAKGGTIESCYSVANGKEHCAYYGEEEENTQVTAFYYLAEESFGRAKTSEQFSSGEVAYLLNTKDNTCSNREIWSQETYPVLVLDETKKPVYQVVCQKEEENTCFYTDSAGRIAEMLTCLPDGYHWQDEKEQIYTQESTFAQDTVLYPAKDKKTIEPFAQTITSVVYNGDIQEYELSKEMQEVDTLAVYYKVNDNWQEEAPDMPGDYDVKLVREGDDEYYYYEQIIEKGLQVEKAVPKLVFDEETEYAYTGYAIGKEAVAYGVNVLDVPSGVITYTYYVDADCLQKTDSTQGAEKAGAPPSKAGTYYVVATLEEDAKYTGVVSEVVEYTIVSYEDTAHIPSATTQVVQVTPESSTTTPEKTEGILQENPQNTTEKKEQDAENSGNKSETNDITTTEKASETDAETTTEKVSGTNTETTTEKVSGTNTEITTEKANETVTNASPITTQVPIKTDIGSAVSEIATQAVDTKNTRWKKGQKVYVSIDGKRLSKKKKVCCEYTVGSGQQLVFTKLHAGKKTIKLLKIPATVTDLQGKKYKVTKIAAGAAKGANIKQVFIGKNVKIIGKKAFYNCKLLVKVRGCKGVKKVKKQAFNQAF